MSTWSASLMTVPSADLTCVRCGHPERDHVLEDVPQALDKRSLCTECEDWHEFAPSPPR
jgi:hypothetical protein